MSETILVATAWEGPPLTATLERQGCCYTSDSEQDTPPSAKNCSPQNARSAKVEGPMRRQWKLTSKPSEPSHSPPFALGREHDGRSSSSHFVTSRREFLC